MRFRLLVSVQAMTKRAKWMMLWNGKVSSVQRAWAQGPSYSVKMPKANMARPFPAITFSSAVSAAVTLDVL